MEAESIVCTNCLHGNDAFRDFCEDCGAPISVYSAYTPLGRIQTEGFAYRQATSNPSKLIVVFGMYLIFIPCIIACLVMIANTIATQKNYLMGAMFIGFNALSFVMLYKTTNSFIENKKKQNQSSEPT